MLLLYCFSCSYLSNISWCYCYVITKKYNMFHPLWCHNPQLIFNQLGEHFITSLSINLFIASVITLQLLWSHTERGIAIKTTWQTHNNHKKASSTSTMQNSRCKRSSATRTNSYSLQKPQKTSLWQSERHLRHYLPFHWKTFCIQGQWKMTQNLMWELYWTHI